MRAHLLTRQLARLSAPLLSLSLLPFSHVFALTHFRSYQSILDIPKKQQQANDPCRSRVYRTKRIQPTIIRAGYCRTPALPLP